MACHVQSAVTRTAWTILIVVFSSLPRLCRACSGNHLRLARGHQPHRRGLKIHRRRSERLARTEFPPGPSPVRILPSDHYAWLDGRVVGIQKPIVTAHCSTCDADIRVYHRRAAQRIRYYFRTPAGRDSSWSFGLPGLGWHFRSSDDGCRCPLSINEMRRSQISYPAMRE